MPRPSFKIYPRTATLLKKWRRWARQDGFDSLSGWICHQVSQANPGRK